MQKRKDIKIGQNLSTIANILQIQLVDFLLTSHITRKKKINNRNIIFEGSDNLCTALQIINHLQDCQKDYISLDRVYLPMSYFFK